MFSKTPCSQKIIFRSSAVDRRRCLSVNEEHVIALAPPGILILQYRHGYAGEMSTACGFNPDVIAFAIQVLLRIYQRIAIRSPLIRPPAVRRAPTVLRMDVWRF